MGGPIDKTLRWLAEVLYSALQASANEKVNLDSGLPQVARVIMIVDNNKLKMFTAVFFFYEKFLIFVGTMTAARKWRKLL